MSFCTKCGKQNTDKAKFCTSCGGALTSIQQPVNSKNNLKIIISVTSLVVVAACYFLFFHKKSNPGITSPITTDTTTIQQPEPFAFKSSYDLPKELVFPRNWEKEGYINPLYPKIFPIGWSRDGKFAYAEEPVDEACGCYFFNIYIQDMYSDKMVWNWKLEMDQEQGYDVEKGNAFYFKKVWAKNNALFSQKLNEYQVEPLPVSRLVKLPMVINNNQCTFSISNRSIYISDFEQSMIASTTISLLVNGAAKKKVFNKKYTYAENFSSTISNNILGYLKSSYENRIALFYITENRGYEGIPTVIDIQMIGCDLSNVGLY